MTHSMRATLMTLGSMACGPGVPDTDADAPTVDWRALAPDAPGPFQVGLRIEPMLVEAIDGSMREVTVNVWYPTTATEGDALDYLDTLPADPALLGNAPIAPAIHVGGHPLILHSHGDQAYGGSSAFLMAHFASHGWVAVAPDHPTNTLLDNIDPPVQTHWFDRAREVSAGIDHVVSHPERYGMIDPSAVLSTGHSRGAGTTTWALAGATFDPAGVSTWCPDCTSDQLDRFDTLIDSRIGATVNLAGWIRRSHYGDGGHATVGTPMLVLTGSEDNAEDDPDQFASTSPVEVVWAELDGGCHQTFALGVCGTLDPERGYRIVSHASMAFARLHLLEDTAMADRFEDGDTIDPVVTLRSR